MSFTTLQNLHLIFALIVTLLISSPSLFAQSSAGETTSSASFFSKNQRFDHEGIELYSSNLELKQHKKFGLGVSLGGANGAIGLNSELNLDPERALVIGLGAGPNYGTFNLLYKRNFEGGYLSPYGKLGYSKWFSASNNTTSAKDSDLLKRFFSEKDLVTGRFDTDFLIASGGVEYNQLEGELSGVNFFGEAVLMTEIKSAKMLLSGAIGIIYFY